ncbi:hypothetical protein [Spirulina sp. 06S082]|uniref:hypothetical protein n=1 Tax=Spirulina sp. 06S082 TaxID=3110248 RepID=UPI002B2118E7|nr:hypothetical protein [Spirulina sp. 06S082]MEA5467574.1 hypothetical protein [Spirulina sp. 06S082]
MNLLVLLAIARFGMKKRRSPPARDSLCNAILFLKNFALEFVFKLAIAFLNILKQRDRTSSKPSQQRRSHLLQNSLSKGDRISSKFSHQRRSHLLKIFSSKAIAPLQTLLSKRDRTSQNTFNKRDRTFNSFLC